MVTLRQNLFEFHKKYQLHHKFFDENQNFSFINIRMTAQRNIFLIMLFANFFFLFMYLALSCLYLIYDHFKVLTLLQELTTNYFSHSWTSNSGNFFLQTFMAIIGRWPPMRRVVQNLYFSFCLLCINYQAHRCQIFVEGLNLHKKGTNFPGDCVAA